MTAGEIAPYGIALVALLLLVAVSLKRRPEIGFLGLWFFLILAPTSSIMPILDLAVEHRMYLPLAAVVTLGVIAVHALVLRLGRDSVMPSGKLLVKWALPALSAIAMVWLGSLTVRRNVCYQSGLSMWRDTVSKAPENYRALNNLGYQLVLSGKLEDAISPLADSVRYRPDYAEANNNLGMALLNTGSPAEAIPYLEEASRLRPTMKQANFNLGQALMTQGRLEESAQHLRREVELSPDDFDAYVKLGHVLELQKKFDEAAGAYRTAVELNGNYLEGLCQFALLLASDEAGAMQNKDEAVELASRARVITRGQQPAVLDVLASVYSSSGQFDRATVVAQHAVELARSVGDEALALQIEKRLELYKSGKTARP